MNKKTKKQSKEIKSPNPKKDGFFSNICRQANETYKKSNIKVDDSIHPFWKFIIVTTYFLKLIIFVLSIILIVKSPGNKFITFLYCLMLNLNNDLLFKISFSQFIVKDECKNDYEIAISKIKDESYFIFLIGFINIYYNQQSILSFITLMFPILIYIYYLIQTKKEKKINK